MKRLIFVSFLLICSFYSWSQHSLHKIEKLIKRNQLDDAWELIDDNIKKGDSSSDVFFYAALCKIASNEAETTLEFLKQSNPDVDKQYYLIKAKAHLLLEQLDLAESAIAKSKEKDETPLIARYINAAQNLVPYPEQVVVRDMSDKINTSGHEYNALMTDSRRGVLFTVRRKDAARTASDGMAYEQIFQAHMDSLDHWQQATKVKTQSASGHHDATIQLLSNGNEMITYHDGDLYIVEKEKNGWSAPIPLEIINTPSGRETHCFFTPNKDTLYFATDYYTGLDTDLYMMTFANEQWSEPVALVELNTTFNDDSPYLAHDGSFYFSSKGHNSMGGYDIFRSDWKNGKWQKPTNMGYLINSTGDDIYYSTHGKIAYLSSNRKGGKGKMDIYQIYLFDKIRIAGQVINKQTKKAIPGAEVIVTNDKESVSAITDEQGIYQMIVPIEQDVKVEIMLDQKSVYENTHRFRVLFRDQNVNEVDLEIDITGESQIGFGEILTVKLRNDENIDPLAPVDISAMNLVDSEIIQKPEPQIVEEKVEKAEVLVKPETVAAEESAPVVAQETIIAKEPTPTPVPAIEEDPKQVVEVEEIRDGTMAMPDLPTVYFGFDKSNIESQYHSALNKVAAYLIDNSRNKLMIVGYTDDKGSSEYNRKLSSRRAKAVLDYLKKQGVDPVQLKMDYKGELSGDAEENRKVSIEIE